MSFRLAAVALTAFAFASIVTAQEASDVKIHHSEAGGVSVRFLNIPWGPQTFSAMEHPGDGFYSDRTWPFTRLESKVAVSIGETDLPAGNYALVFHPNKGQGMVLEAVKIAAGEFLQEGNIMTKTPEGDSVYKSPAIFELVDETLPALEVSLVADDDEIRLRVAYGNRRLQRTLKRREVK